MGEGRRRCRSGPWDEGTGGVYKGHFHIPAGMVVRGGRRQDMWQPALHMSQRSILPSSKFGTPGTAYHQRGGWQGEEMKDGTGPVDREDRCLEK